jgi:hypothetical protein
VLLRAFTTRIVPTIMIRTTRAIIHVLRIGCFREGLWFLGKSGFMLYKPLTLYKKSIQHKNK